MSSLFSNWKTVPNLLSLIRILLIPVFAVLFYKGYYIWAVVAIVLSGLSDLFDGKIARRFNQVSELGKVLDPVADKLTQVTIAVLLFVSFKNCSNTSMKAFSWVFLYFLGKEGLMLLLGGIMLAMKCRPIAAEIYGKAATTVFYISMGLIVGFGPEIGALRNLFTLPNAVVMGLVIICAVFTTIALLSYVSPSIKEVKRVKAEKNT